MSIRHWRQATYSWWHNFSKAHIFWMRERRLCSSRLSITKMAMARRPLRLRRGASSKLGVDMFWKLKVTECLIRMETTHRSTFARTSTTNNVRNTRDQFARAADGNFSLVPPRMDLRGAILCKRRKEDIIVIWWRNFTLTKRRTLCSTS